MSGVLKARAAGGAGGGGGALSDPRPIGSKTFQGETIAAVVDYCTSTAYRAGPISVKILGSPTGKDFAAIVGHLLARLDASFALAGRIEDEVQTVFKALR